MPGKKPGTIIFGNCDKNAKSQMYNLFKNDVFVKICISVFMRNGRTAPIMREKFM